MAARPLSHERMNSICSSSSLSGSLSDGLQLCIITNVKVVLWILCSFSSFCRELPWLRSNSYCTDGSKRRGEKVPPLVPLTSWSSRRIVPLLCVCVCPRVCVRVSACVCACVRVCVRAVESKHMLADRRCLDQISSQRMSLFSYLSSWRRGQSGSLINTCVELR